MREALNSKTSHTNKEQKDGHILLTLLLIKSPLFHILVATRNKNGYRDIAAQRRILKLVARKWRDAQICTGIAKSLRILGF